jgi:hypothetical protein
MLHGFVKVLEDVGVALLAKPLGNDGWQLLSADPDARWSVAARAREREGSEALTGSLALHADNSREAALSLQPLSTEACTSFA